MTELEDDVFNLSDFIQFEDHKSVSEFAHKYQMRLNYFDKKEALDLCYSITQSFKQGTMEELTAAANSLQSLLKEILNQFKNESAGS